MNNNRLKDNVCLMNRRDSIYNNQITEGVIWKQLLAFFFPIVLGTLFQQLYNTADAIIVGQLLGKEALAAVGGGTGTAISLLIGFFTGLASGATVIISQYYGARDEERVRLSVHNAVAIALYGGIAVSVAGYFTAEPLLRLIKTPDDIILLAARYMRIYFAGGILIVMYNMGSGIFRAFGDSRSPLMFLIAGCIANIVLDILFVGVLKMDVEGAAYATVLSQAVSLFMVVLKLRKRDDCCRLEYRRIRTDKVMLQKTIAIGLPAGIQSTMYTISNLIIQANINGFGTDAAAAWAAYGKLDSFFWMIISAFGIAITTFVGQNYGAGLIDRARRGVRECLVLSVVFTAVLEAVYIGFGRYGFMLFTHDENVIETGRVMLNAIAPYFFTFICVEILSGAIRGTGKSLLPTLFSVFGICGLRMLWLAAVSPSIGTITGVVACYPVTWTFTSLLFVVYYLAGDIYGTRKGRVQ